MNKHWKTVALGGLFIVGILIAYYFLLFLPQQKQHFVENEIACKKAGVEYYKSIDQSTPYGAIYKDPEYVFNSDLNTCLYRKEYSDFFGDGSLATDNYSIIDIYSNKTVVSLFHHYNLAGHVNETIGNDKDYTAAVKKYFGESTKE